MTNNETSQTRRSRLNSHTENCLNYGRSLSYENRSGNSRDQDQLENELRSLLERYLDSGDCCCSGRNRD